MLTASQQIFTKFDENLKKNNIEALKKIYLGVFLLTRLNEKRVTVDGKDCGIRGMIEDFIQKKETQGRIGNDGPNIILTQKDNSTYSVKFDQSQEQVDIKGVDEYSIQDLYNLCGKYELEISKNQQGDYEFSVKVKKVSEKGKDVIIGGPGKMSIFPQHLFYLRETIKHLENSNENNPTKEFALATGSGKTFIELLVEYLPSRLTGTRYVSVAPNDSLASQKRSDWQKFISDDDMSDIEEKVISGSKGCSILSEECLKNNWNAFLKAVGLEQLPKIIKALNIEDKNFEVIDGKINVDGKDFVILADKIKYNGKDYLIKDTKVKIGDQEFELNIKNSVSLSFDEEHKIVEKELYKHRMAFLSTLCPTLFLSATPSPENYNRIKESKGLLKTLSLQEKRESGNFGELELKVSPQREQKDNLVNCYIKELEGAVTVKKETGKENCYHRPDLNLPDDELYKDIEKYLFHNVQSVIGESALILSESGDINKELKDVVTRDMFKDQNNDNTHSNTVDKKYNEIINHLSTKYPGKTRIIKQVVNENLDYKSEMQDYSAFRVMHGIIDNTLSCLTGLSRAELDQERFSNLEGLVANVEGKINQLNDFNTMAGQYVDKCGIKDANLKNEIVEQMNLVKGVLSNSNRNLFIRLVRNWNQDKQLHKLMPLSNIPNEETEIFKLFGLTKSSIGTDRFELNERENYSVHIFESLKNSYELHQNISSIEDNCKRLLFLAIQKQVAALEFSEDNKYQIMHDEGLKQQFRELKKEAKDARNNLIDEFQKIKTEFDDSQLYKLTRLRAFSDKYRYIERSDDNEKNHDYDMLLKAGLCGNYVNSKKIEGFNSVDLQHVVILIDKESNEINRPPQLIQGPGRLRTLNPARLSTLFCESSEKLKFDITLLEKGDYLDQYNKALEEDKKRTTEEAGDGLVRCLNECIENTAKEIASKTSAERVKKANELTNEIISEVISSFEKVYNDKRHNAKEAQDYFAEVLEYVTSKVEEQLKENNIIVGKFDIEYDIRSIESKIAQNNDAVKDKNKKITELQSQALETESSLKDIQTKITDLLKKISQNNKEQKEVGERLEIKGNVIEKLFIKLYRLVRRLIFCRIELEKQKIKLEKEGYKLKQEENQENKNKIEKETEKVKLANEEEKLEKEKEQIAEESTTLEQEKEELEKKLEPKKKKFIGLIECIKDRKNREITQEERREIINEHKQTLTKDISTKEEELEKNEEDACKLLCDFLRDVSKDLIERNKISREKVAETARAEVTVQEGSAIERAVKKALEEIKQKAVEKEDQQIHMQGQSLNRIFEEINEILINSTTKDISESLQEVTTKIKGVEWVVIHSLDREGREGGLSDRMSNFQDKAKELIKQRVNLAEKKAELKKNKEYAEGFLTPLLISQPGTTKPTLKECKEYCNDIVNKELLQKSVENNYSPEQITWITEVFKDFNKLFKTEDYKDNLQYADQHIEDCKKSQVFLELLSNTFVPLMNTGNLLIALNACYPEGGNQERENQIRSCYNKLINNKVDEVSKHDIECVMSYIEKIQDQLKAPEENSPLYHQSALQNAKLEIERLKNKETLKIKSEIHDCVLTKIKKGFSQFIDDVQREDMTQQENIASAARKVGTDFKNIKSLNLGEIISPNTRFLNPLAKLQENRYVDGPNRG